MAATSRGSFNQQVVSGDAVSPPGYSYNNIDPDQLWLWRDELTALAQDAIQLNMSVEANRLVRENITNRLNEVGILFLTKMQQEIGPDDPRYDAISFQLGMNMQEVYGRPEVGHWRGILGYRMQQLRAVSDRTDAPQVVRDAWAFIEAELPQDLPVETPYVPRDETVAWYKQQLEARLAPARQAVTAAIERGDIVLNKAGKLDGANLVKATRIALEARGAENWTAEPTDEANIDTTQSHRTIFIPHGREMTMSEFDQVIQGHEIDIHVMRRVNGDASSEQVLGGTGCNGYLGWDEGHGKANEALLEGKAATEASAFAFYLSAGLALGLDGRRMRNHPDTHALVWRMNFVDAYLRGKVTDANADAFMANTVQKATKHLDRIFRGTDGRMPGVVFTKDALTYYLGQTEVWRKWDRDMALPEDIRTAEHLLERSAKIDPLRPDHRRVAISGFRPWLVR
jgi:hypothetical protein